MLIALIAKVRFLLVAPVLSFHPFKMHSLWGTSSLSATAVSFRHWLLIAESYDFFAHSRAWPRLNNFTDKHVRDHGNPTSGQLLCIASSE